MTTPVRRNPRRERPAVEPAATAKRRRPSERPAGLVLVVHANDKPYGKGAGGSKPSNRTDFAFSAADYLAMRDSGLPYSGDPGKNKLLPLPRPTYTEFVNRAKQARIPQSLWFLYCPASAPDPPRLDWSAYSRVIWCGVSFRRFARRWTPERHHLFAEGFRRRAETLLGCAGRLRREEPGRPHLGSLPDEVMHQIIRAALPADARREGYDDLDTVLGGTRHLFLPAPGSSGVREALFDAAFGLY